MIYKKTPTPDRDDDDADNVAMMMTSVASPSSVVVQS